MVSRAVIGLLAVVVLWPLPATACTAQKISGTWSVLVIEHRWDMRGGIYELDQLDEHAICRFVVRANRPPSSARLNIKCTGDQRLFEQDCIFGCPWHQLQLVQGCRWRIIDFNKVDATYDVVFAPDGKQLIGTGSAHIPEPGVFSFSRGFTGIK